MPIIQTDRAKQLIDLIDEFVQAKLAVAYAEDHKDRCYAKIDKFIYDLHLENNRGT